MNATTRKARAESEFTLDSWDTTDLEKLEGTDLSRARVTKTFTGELAGTSWAELVFGVTEAGAKTYLGLERVTATLHGRAGSFVLEHAAYDRGDGTGSTQWSILPHSGTGELAGLSGTAEIAIDENGGHTLVLDYELPDQDGAPKP
jgi:hypothetical protein